MKRSYTMNWLAALACSALMFGTVACNSGGGSGSSTAATTYPYSTNGIYGNGTSGSLYTSYGSMFSMNLGVNSNGSQVALTGIMTVNQVIYCGSGYIPQGQYNIQTSYGSISGNYLGSMQMQASGPITFTIGVNSGVIDYSTQGSLSLNMTFPSCGQVITD